jgi:predicted transcriptional regulator
MDSHKSVAEMTAAIVASYVKKNSLPTSDLPALIKIVYAALSSSGQDTERPGAEPPVPAVGPKKSIMPDYLICLEDGKSYRSLKRHLSTHHNLTPDQYRARWSLPLDYPMVAPNYAATRSRLAKQMGLGSHRAAPRRRRVASRGG